MAIQFKVDNIAVVHDQVTYSQEPYLMHLIRILFFATHFNFWFSASLVAGTDNSLVYFLIMQQHPTISIADVTSHVPPFNDSSSSDKAIGMQHYMDYHSLDNAVQAYFAAALAPSTHLTYNAAEFNICLFIVTSISLPYLLQRHPYVILSPA